MKNRFDLVGQTFGNNLNTLQSGRVNALEDATDLQVMARSLIEHEALRIERKLGKQHPRTLQLNARITANLAMIESLQVEREIAQIKAPDITEQDAWVQGRVRDENARGFAGLTICLIDKEDTPSSDLNPATTGLSGHYAIVINQDLASAIVENQHAPLFLGVFSPQNRLVYKTKRPLAIKPGARITEEVTLDRKTLSDLSGPKKPRPKPEPDTVTVPDLIGLTESVASESIKSTGLKSGDRKEQIVVDQVGLVLEQDPVAGATVEPESPVHIVIGVARQVTVPELVGLPLREATTILRESNLTVGQVTDRPDDRHDIVLEQKPRPGEEVPAGTEVVLVVGRRQEAPQFRAKVVELFQSDDLFQDLGISATALSNRLEAQNIDNVQQLKALVEASERDLRNTMRLPNLRSARTFKEILNRVLAQLD